MSEEQIERERQREKTAEPVDKKLQKIERELAELAQESPGVTTEAQRTTTEEQRINTEVSTKDQFLKTIPSWTKKPFMYITSPNAAMKKSWLQKWSDLVLNYCRILNVHIISVEQLRHEEPFKNTGNGKQLTLDQMREIVDHLCEKNLAKWLDDKRLRVRVYYVTLEEMADDMLRFVLDRGLDTELAITIPEFRGYGQKWSNLPDEDLDEVFRILERRKKIRPIDKKRDAFTFRK